MKSNNINSGIIRPIQEDDLNSIYELSKERKKGLSSIPKTFNRMKKVIHQAHISFQNKNTSLHHKFLFALEYQNKVIGISGIKSRTGIKRPYYGFLYHQNVRYPYLEIVKQYLGPSELGSLFLSPRYRSQKLGKLLSLSRFLFIKSHKNHFTNTIIAELRGYFYKNNTSPVWNAIGKKFTNLRFKKADELSIHDETFLDRVFPQKPIYTHLLKKNIHKYFKAVHPNTEAAKHLLLKENFRITNIIDIFDGGPILECTTNECRTIKNTKEININNINYHLSDNERYLISNTKYKTFRAIKHIGKVNTNQLSDLLQISSKEKVLVFRE